MNSRISLVALGLFIAGCGAGGGGPSGVREPMLSCDGLSRDDCATSSGCYVEELACIALCVDPNGTGDCQSPCAEDFRCLPRPASCEALDEAACNADSRCEYVAYACDTMCRDDGHGGCLPCEVPPAACRTRQPPACESLEEAACNADARCEYITWACTMECRDDGQGGCLPCNAPPSGCHTRQTPVSCYGLAPDACDAQPECEFVARNTCACVTAPCDCPVIEPSCQPREPVSCYGLTPDACDARPDCEFVTRDVCACAPGVPCDCPIVEPSCQPRQPTPVSCYGLTPDVCDAHPECEFVARDTCVCNGDPACSCPAIEPSCQPRQPTSRCEALSPQQCINTPGCGLLEAACACPPNAVCDCNAPETRCVDVTEPQPDPCAGLDLAACTADSRCEIGHLVCTAECRDDGQGGCLPCPDTAVCQVRVEPPVAGCGGTPPPAP